MNKLINYNKETQAFQHFKVTYISAHKYTHTNKKTLQMVDKLMAKKHKNNKRKKSGDFISAQICVHVRACV